jgi:Ca-activated chloride channel family protein
MIAMSFLHPGRLWLLFAVAAVAVGYVAIHLRHRHAVTQYTSTHLHSSIAPDRLGWRRHVAPILAAGALGLIVVGLAQPVHAVQVPRDEGVVVLTVDVSASMTANDIQPSRIQAAIAGASKFVQQVPDGIQVGLIAFDGTARVLVDPTTDHASVIDAVKTLSTGPRTATGDALETALGTIRSTLSADVLKSGDIPASVVLLSDGAETVGRPVLDVAQEAKRLGVPVTTIAYGTPTGTVVVQGQIVDVPADTTTMSEIAQITGGKYYEAASASDLDKAYTDIKTVVGYRTEPREVTRSFLGGALAFLLLGTPFAFVRSARAL